MTTKKKRKFVEPKTDTICLMSDRHGEFWLRDAPPGSTVHVGIVLKRKDYQALLKLARKGYGR